MKKIAIVTVNYAGTKDTLDLIESVKKLDKDGIDFKFVVVDSTPGEWIGDSLKDKPDYLDFLQTGENKGFAGNYNFGMKFAVAWGADYIIIINNDTLFGDKLLLKKLVKVFDENRGVSVVSPKIYFAPGYEFYKDRYKKQEQGHVIWYAGGSFDWNNLKSIHRGIDEVDTGKYDKMEKTGFVSGCCLMVTREVLEKVGYFDESLFAYFEDNDWQKRILQSGGKLFYTGSTFIYHKVSRTTGIGSEQTDYLLTRNRLYFASKYASFRTKFALTREAIRQLLTGRFAQRKAIGDFLKRVKGKSPFEKRITGEFKYPVRLSILISNYKTKKLTDNLLASIFSGNSGFDRGKDEVLVIDDASGDDLSDLKTKYPAARFLQNDTNRGFVASYNRLIEFSRGELLLMLNSDIEVREDALKSLIVTIRINNDGVVLTGQLFFPDGTVQDSCFRLPTIWGAFKEYFLGIKGSYFMYRPESKEPVKVEGAVMAVFLIPRKVLNKIGLLNKKLFMYFEDIDYCRRLKEANIPVYFCPEAKFYHHHGAASKEVGTELSNQQLIKSSKIYHGAFIYNILTFVLRVGQKLGRVKTPVSRWAKS